jgi:hypothetical protein
MKAAMKQRILDHWATVVGVPPKLLVEQLPVFLREWGPEKVLEAVELVAKHRPPGRRITSRENFGALMRVFDAWRRAKKK